MAPVISDAMTSVYHGNSIDVLKSLSENSVDSVVCDPPYGLADLPVKKVAQALGEWVSGDRAYIPGGRGFMNAEWDRFVPPPALWDEAYRVLKPGGYLIAFAGTRTQDLMGMSIRLAGFTLKNTLAWARGDVFPKTKHTLKPGYEPIIMAQKPLDGTIAQNIAKWGVGGVNVDATRTPFRNAADELESKSKNQHGKYETPQGGNAVFGDFSMVEARKDYDAPGRWPTNLILNEISAADLDAANPTTRSRKSAQRASAHSGDGWRMKETGAEYDDEGGPSRFYPMFAEDSEPIFYAGRATVKERPVVDGFGHSTVKPLSVMGWCIRLVTPAGGLVLDMFAGSGTTGEAARLGGFQSILIEAHEPYIPLIKMRMVRSADDNK
jgi:site-specific DNA-methyltransferase (adenine-specific)